MIIFNITMHVTWAIHDKWKRWMMEEYIPEMLASGLFEKHQMIRLLEAEDEEGATYAVQFYASQETSITQYRERHLAYLQEKEKNLWKGNMFSFTSLMEVIN